MPPARNILLLILLADDVDGSNGRLIWSIYYRLYLDEPSRRLLVDQSEKLYILSESLQSWHKSEYGTFLRFCDLESLTRIREAWKLFQALRSSGSYSKRHQDQFASAILRAKETRRARTGDGFTFTGLRSSAPLSLQALADLPRLNERFWDSGVTDELKKARRVVTYPNPTFVASTIEIGTLHYGTDPLAGFHLATAYAALHPESPLRARCGDGEIPRAVEAARLQFNSWSDAFRSHLSKSIRIRFFAGDAMAFCHALRMRSEAGKSCPTHLYRDTFHPQTLTLDETEYSEKGNAPTVFSVIDTSNLIDHLGGLNLLVASSPLLMKSVSATLYTECLVKREESIKAAMDELLCGDLATISTLLGLFPVEYWTNASAISTVDEALFDVASQMMAGSQGPNGQMPFRLAWKRNPLCLDSIDLAHLLFGIYEKMF